MKKDIYEQVTSLLKSTQIFPIILWSEIFTKVYKVTLDHLSYCIFYSFPSIHPFSLASLLLEHTNTPVLYKAQKIHLCFMFLWCEMLFSCVLHGSVPAFVQVSPSMSLSQMCYSTSYWKITPLVTLPPLIFLQLPCHHLKIRHILVWFICLSFISSTRMYVLQCRDFTRHYSRLWIQSTR